MSDYLKTNDFSSPPLRLVIFVSPWLGLSIGFEMEKKLGHKIFGQKCQTEEQLKRVEQILE